MIPKLIIFTKMYLTLNYLHLCQVSCSTLPFNTLSRDLNDFKYNYSLIIQIYGFYFKTTSAFIVPEEPEKKNLENVILGLEIFFN